MAIKRTNEDEFAGDDPNHGEAIAEAVKGMPPKIVKVSEELSCELNDVEWASKARELADAHNEVNRQEQRKKDVVKELGHDVSMAKTKESKLADIVATRREQRDVTVEVRYDYDLGKVTRTRTDTDEVISEREMTDQERQQELDLQDANSFIDKRHQPDGSAFDDAEDINEGELDEEDAADGRTTSES